MFRIAKTCHQDFGLLHIIILIITSLFLNKSGSPLMCFNHVLHGHVKPYVYGFRFTLTCSINKFHYGIFHLHAQH
jgi:hypothetical protein